MFYSHEVLTSHKYGVATVWLMAMHDSKSNVKRINRKQILDVDVGKACQTIISPVAPMALRLQSNLLYGVSRVYLQQCGYVLSDAQNVQNMMRMLLRTVKSASLDLDAGKSRPEQLVLADDPSFLPDFPAPAPDLFDELDPIFGLEVARPDEFQTLSPFGSQPSRSSPAGDLGGIILPSSSPDIPGGFKLEGGSAKSSIGKMQDLLHAGETEDLLEPDFMFGDDGDIIELTTGHVNARTPAGPGRVSMQTDAGASEKVRREHEEGARAGTQIPADPMDLDLPIYADDLPEGLAFSPAAPNSSTDPSQLASSSSTIAAPMRRKKRSPRSIPVDHTTELRNKDLADWNANYVQNMQQATRAKKKTRSYNLAKKNAEHFVWGAGIGGIADQMLGDTGLNLFSMFIGDNLFELVTGVSRKKTAGLKHDRDSGIDDATQQESRRVRQKTSDPEEEMGRDLENEGFSLPGDEEVELPREAASALNDQEMFSTMPWNMSASGRGSSAIPHSGRVGIIGSADQARRASRLVSASPLFGRGGPPGGLEALQHLESEGDYGFGGDDFALPEPSSDFPGAGDLPIQPHPTQTSARVREALSAEGENFLTFVSDAIAEKRTRLEAEHEDFSQSDANADRDEITFEELLPPQENNRMVACQGLMMTLALGMKGMLGIEQPEHFGPIGLKLSDKAKAMQVIEISDNEDPVEISSDSDDTTTIDGEEGGGEESGQFDEQMAAGTGVADIVDDEHDSLYDD